MVKLEKMIIDNQEVKQGIGLQGVTTQEMEDTEETHFTKKETTQQDILQGWTDKIIRCQGMTLGRGQIQVVMFKLQQDRFTTCFKTCGTKSWVFSERFYSKKGAKMC